MGAKQAGGDWSGRRGDGRPDRCLRLLADQCVVVPLDHNDGRPGQAGLPVREGFARIEERIIQRDNVLELVRASHALVEQMISKAKSD